MPLDSPIRRQASLCFPRLKCVTDKGNRNTVKFTVLSHAGLYVEHNGVSIVVDPWLIGSCYWRSWWNYPEPDRNLIDDLKPDYIYLTHLHWDHFHGPSLRRFDRNTKMLVPLVQTLRMLRDLKQLGFQNVKEIAHGEKLEL